MIRRSILSALAFSLALVQAAAAGPICAIPADLKPWPAETVSPGEVAKVATVFHVLAVAWAPEWCRTNGEIPATAQRLPCETLDRGFFLHGLWPNGHGRPYPRYCTPVGTMDLATVRRMYCRTPSAELLQHEWQAHGGCGWTDPKVYFRQSSKLFDRLKLPRIEDIAPDRLTAGAIRAAFVATNRWLRPEMIMIGADREGHFTEARLCYGRDFKPLACPDGAGPADSTPLRLTPSKAGRF